MKDTIGAKYMLLYIIDENITDHCLLRYFSD